MNEEIYSSFTFTGGMGLDIGIESTNSFELLACVEKVPNP